MRSWFYLGFLLGAMSIVPPTAHAGKLKIPVAATEALKLVKTDRTAAIGKLTTELLDARGADRTWLLIHLAEQERLSGQHDVAHTHFREALGSKKAQQGQDAIQLGMSLLDATTDAAGGGE